MDNQIQTQNSINLSEITGYSQDEINLMKATTAKNTTDLEFAQFASVCKTADLNPFNKEIWCYVVGQGTPKRAVVMFASRDGFRKAAHKNPNFVCVNAMEVRKNDEFKMSNIDGETVITHSFSGTNTERGIVVGAYAIVKLKNGNKVSEWADFSEYNKNRQMWNTNQSEMIKKVAEAHALKKITNLSGIYAEEEFKIVDGKVINEQINNTGQDNASKLLDKGKELEPKQEKEEPKISMEEGNMLLGAIQESESDLDKVLEFYKIKSIYEITEKQALDLSIKLKAKEYEKKKDETKEIKKIEEQDKIIDMPPVEKKESKAAQSMREAKKKTEEDNKIKEVPENVCQYLNAIKNINDLPYDILTLQLDCNKGGFKGIEAYPNLAEEMTKYNIK